MEEDHFIGAFIAHAIGDAIGAPYEFYADRNRKWNGVIELEPRIFNKYKRVFRCGVPGQVTDDTEMTHACLLALTTAMEKEASLVAGTFAGETPLDHSKEEAILRYLEWANPPSFQGRNTRKLLVGVKTLKGYESRFKKLISSGEVSESNGPLMRHLPFVFLSGLSERNFNGDEDVNITNPNDICRDACFIYRYTILKIKEGFVTRKEIRSHLVEVFKRKIPGLRDKLEIKKSFSGKEKGWIWHPIAYLVWCLENFSIRVASLRKIADDLLLNRRGCDSDTVLSIVFGAYGCWLGAEALLADEWFSSCFQKVLSCDSSKGEFPRPDKFSFKNIYGSLPELWKSFERFNKRF